MGFPYMNKALVQNIDELEVVIHDLPENTIVSAYLGLIYYYLGITYAKKKEKEKLTNMILLILTDFAFDRHLIQFAGELLLYDVGKYGEANLILGFAQGISEFTFLGNNLPSLYYNLEQLHWLNIETSVLIGDNEQARKYFELCNSSSNQINGDVQQARQSIQNGHFSDVIHQLEGKKLLSGDDYRILEKSYLATSQWEKAHRTIINAAAISGIIPHDYLDLAFCQIQLNRLHYAKDLLLVGQKLEPDNPAFYNLSNLIAIKEENFHLAVEMCVHSFIIDSINPVYQANLEQVAAKLNMTPIEALKYAGEKWLNDKDYQNGLRALIVYSRFNTDDQEVNLIISSYLQQSAEL